MLKFCCASFYMFFGVIFLNAQCGLVSFSTSSFYPSLGDTLFFINTTPPPFLAQQWTVGGVPVINTSSVEHVVTDNGLLEVCLEVTFSDCIASQCQSIYADSIGIDCTNQGGVVTFPPSSRYESGEFVLGIGDDNLAKIKYSGDTIYIFQLNQDLQLIRTTRLYSEGETLSFLDYATSLSNGNILISARTTAIVSQGRICEKRGALPL